MTAPQDSATDNWSAHWSNAPPQLAQRFNQLTARDVLPLLDTMNLPPLTALPVSTGSVENRVFIVQLTGGRRLVLKLYRPHRWERAALLEELAFIDDLRAAGVPVVEPLALPSGGRLGRWRGIYFVAFETVATHAHPDVWQPDALRQLGRLAARIHAVGSQRAAHHRMRIVPAGYGGHNLRLLAGGRLIPTEVRDSYCRIAHTLIERSSTLFEGVPLLRVHGDFGIHNMLRGAEGVVIADFDDFSLGPAIFDLCQLHRGLNAVWGDAHHDAQARARALGCFVTGYREHRALPEQELKLVGVLRGLRLIWNDAWKQARMHDEHFCATRQEIFTRLFWVNRLAALRESLDAVSSVDA